MSATLQPGMIPACVFQQLHMSELTLSKRFVVDLFDQFADLPPLFGERRRLTHQMISDDIFNGACSRELVTRACNGDPVAAFDPPASFAIIGAILLRERIPLTPTRSAVIHKPKHLHREQRQQILALLYHYGVQCADGSCCHLTRDPVAINYYRLKKLQVV